MTTNTLKTFTIRTTRLALADHSYTVEATSAEEALAKLKDDEYENEEYLGCDFIDVLTDDDIEIEEVNNE